MALIRLILLVVILGGLTLLLVQNWSPALPLFFLGARTRPLPLALLLLFSTAAGAATSILISTLLKFANSFAEAKPKISSRPRATAPRSRTTPRPEPTPSARSSVPPANNEFDDWETGDQENDDWAVEDQPKTENPNPAQRQEKPKNTSGSGSVYSYNAQEPKNTAVGKTESVYDADYRVIIPPYQPSTTNQTDEDDWNFLDDDDFEADNQPSRR
jgi:hypothetical protein